MKKIIFIFFIILTASFVFSFYFQNEVTLDSDFEILDVFFCPHDYCGKKLISFINMANKSLNCEFYDIDDKYIINSIINKSNEIDVSILVDKSNDIEFFKKIDQNGLMHHKFCLIDDEYVFVGSYNPTINGAYKNNNNIIILKGKSAYDEYYNEFLRLNGLDYKYKSKFIKFNRHIYETLYNKIKSANKSIKIAAFTFTDPDLADLIIEKHLSGIDVKILLEKRQISKWSQYERFLKYDIVKKDFNKNNMHNKFFIIDDKLVITGSYNPTRNAKNRNSENIIIIDDQKYINDFISEFNFLYNPNNYGVNYTLLKNKNYILYIDINFNKTIIKKIILNDKYNYTRVYFENDFFLIKNNKNYFDLIDSNNYVIKRISKKEYYELI